LDCEIGGDEGCELGARIESFDRGSAEDLLLFSFGLNCGTDAVASLERDESFEADVASGTSDKNRAVRHFEVFGESLRRML